MKPAILALASVLAVSSSALAVGPTVSVKFTSQALGLGTSDINSGSTVTPDMAGKLITSPVTGQGSILYVQQNGLAGQNNLLATVTSRTHLDTLTYPTGMQPGDHQAGVLYITRENTSNPDGKDEGLGVRAFAVSVGTSAFTPTRTFSGGLAKIEGSKEISGGNGPVTFNTSKPNGAPHVDEDILVTFDPAAHISANTLVITLAKFATSNKADITINLIGGGSINMVAGSTHSAFSKVGGDNYTWNINVGALTGLGADAVSSFAVRAINPNPSDTGIGTKGHFLLSGFSGQVIPAPSVAALLGIGGLAGMRRRRAVG